MADLFLLVVYTVVYARSSEEDVHYCLSRCMLQIPKKSEIMGVIPWNKMERYVFGVNHHGIFKINKQTGKVATTHVHEHSAIRAKCLMLLFVFQTIFTRRFSDLYQWTRTEARFQLVSEVATTTYT